MSKKKIDSYSQCLFVQEGEGPRIETTGYIDAKQARVGARMTLKGVEGTWIIEKAGPAGPAPHGGRLDAMD